ncbi:MAG: YkgJ family cysteine cluster protein, partial [Deltaproteobacteria bacterium]|nr:YkgJ family cysteine cluster protein [Deltaproteobacteria bacterium]
CGACCREAYDCVQLSPRDPVRRLHPELVVRRGPYLEIARSGGRCSALAVTGDAAAPAYACQIYGARPRSCREFENAGAHCLVARRRVGLSL